MADRPITEISLKDVRKLIGDKNIGEDVFDAVGQLLGIVIALSPVVAGPGALVLWGLIEPKNELIAGIKSAARKISKSKPDDYLDRAERMAVANCLLLYVAFCDAVRGQWPTILEELSPIEEKLDLTEKTGKKALKEATSRALLEASDADAIVNWAVPVPHPVDGTSRDKASRQLVFLRLASTIVSALPVIEHAHGPSAEDIRSRLANEIVGRAENLYQADYLGMAVEFQQFFVWSVLRDQEANAGRARQLAEDQRAWFELISRATYSLDLGMQGLAEAVAGLPHAVQAGVEESRVQTVAEGLHRTYADVLQQQLIDEQIQTDEAGVRLRFPRKIDGFIPQAYRRVLYDDNADIHLEDEDAWRGREMYDSIGAFILQYLESPYSVRTPLLILGHPGSGKSLLTEVLAGHLVYPTHTTVRVRLRDIDPDVGFLTQLEQQIREDTGGRSIAWADFAEGLRMCPPVVILDGYDELLQATGKVYASYLDEVRQFQYQQAVQHRPVRVIVTSRLTLIDKVAVPRGTTVVKLEEFDADRRAAWCDRWNRHNEAYFQERGVQPFEPPDSGRLLELARQPLLLLMLAIYDSLGNELSSQPDIDQTLLYDRLLRRFIERELSKGNAGHEFTTSSAAEQEQAISHEMDRLGVAAIGMFNRQDVKISREDLNADLRYFDLQKGTTADGRALAEADLLLGSFFFIHESRSRLPSTDVGTGTQVIGSAAFEFLHNTFGEFLVADFILRRALEEARTICSLTGNADLARTRVQQLATLSENWFGALLHTSLYTRPVILSMLREWSRHQLNAQQWPSADILAALDAIVAAQLRLVLNDMTISDPSPAQRTLSPYLVLPRRGHLTIYSLNLVLLRAYLGDSEYVLEESSLGDRAGTCRPWDGLASLWRGWLTLESLGTLAESVIATRRGEQIVITIGRSELAQGAGSPLNDLYNSAVALADGVTAAVVGLHVASFARMPQNLFTRFWEEFGDAVPELGPTACVLRMKMFAFDGDELEDPVSGASAGELRLSLNLLDDGAEVACDFADVVARLARTPRQLRRVRVRQERLDELGQLSRYEAEVAVDARMRVQPGWLVTLLTQGYSPREWEEFMRTPAAAPVLLAAAQKGAFDHPGGAMNEIGHLVQDDATETITLDTASALAVLGYRWGRHWLYARLLDVIIDKCRQGAWSLLDVPVQAWEGLGELISSPGSVGDFRRNEFLTLLESAVEKSINDVEEDDLRAIRRLTPFWTEALRIGATRNEQRIQRLTRLNK